MPFRSPGGSLEYLVRVEASAGVAQRCHLDVPVVLHPKVIARTEGVANVLPGVRPDSVVTVAAAAVAGATPHDEDNFEHPENKTNFHCKQTHKLLLVPLAAPSQTPHHIHTLIHPRIPYSFQFAR